MDEGRKSSALSSPYIPYPSLSPHVCHPDPNNCLSASIHLQTSLSSQRALMPSPIRSFRTRMEECTLREGIDFPELAFAVDELEYTARPFTLGCCESEGYNEYYGQKAQK